MMKVLRVMAWLSLGVAVLFQAAPAADQRITARPAVQQRFTATPLTEGTTISSGAVKLADGQRLVSVVVKLDEDAVATYRGGLPGLPATSPAVTARARLDLREPRVRAYMQYMQSRIRQFRQLAAAAAPRARVIHELAIVVGGVAMQVPESQVAALASLPGVAGIYPDEVLRVDTESSPAFVGAPALWARLGGQGNAGEGVIVGILDSGVWPEHPSFSDPDPAGRPYAAPPDWFGTACQFGSTTPGDLPFACNNKLIGAQRFMAAHEAGLGIVPGEFLSARDDDGHGTHTASTAAGNGGVAASVFAVPRGIISGIAPRAHLAVYRVCGPEGSCYSSDSAAAVQQAILDGVDVINFSISGGTEPYSDIVSLAFFDAYNAGVFVAASAGNSGPGPDTVGHREPWVTTVAASTQARAFVNTTLVTGDTPTGNLSFTGASVTAGVPTPSPIVVPTPDPLCASPFQPGTLTGAIVVCRRGTAGRVEKGFNVAQGGAAGMILYNQSPSVTDLSTDNHFLPTTQIQYADGVALLDFLATHTNVRATMTAGEAEPAQGDVMASFSSRGGPAQTLSVLKPDVAAPGVQVLAGHTPLPVYVTLVGPQGQLFQAIAGTSMSSPHVAGAAALLKALNPGWTPGRIKSALMTTAWTAVVKEDGVTPADPFDMGSGRMNLARAGSPGLTISAPAADFLTYRDNLALANLPSLYVPTMLGKVMVTRTLQSELKVPKIWRASVESTPDVEICAPWLLLLPGGGKTKLPISIDASRVPLGEVRHARLALATLDGSHKATFPISIVRSNGVTTIDKSCDLLTIARGATANCTVTMTNGGFAPAAVTMTDIMPVQLRLESTSAGVIDLLNRRLTFNGVLAGGQPPDVSVGPGSTPAGYLPLANFGVAALSMGDDTFINFSVPAFAYAGETYTQLGVSSNGYLVVGPAGSLDNTPINQGLPDAVRPNNVLAPFWTDLNPAAGGAVRIGILTDGVTSWIVVDWNQVRQFGSAAVNSFEAWIRIGTAEDISFAYDVIQGSGAGGLLTVGAENRYGNRGQNYYYNGTGILPAQGTELRVTGTAPSPGETRTIDFRVKGVFLGSYTDCAEMKSPVLFGTATACVSGSVVK